MAENEMDKTSAIKIVRDIRFWIFLFFLIRLFGITDPPLEAMHSWRQALTNMIARNFLEISPNILFPRIDMAGELTGIIGSEFPFLSYLVFLVSKIFGYDHWYGRLINLFVSSTSLYYFFLIAKKYFSREIAFNATIILTVSIWFSFSRKIMPDVFSVSLVIIGLYYCLEYMEKGHLTRLLLFFFFTTLGTLSKIPALTLMSLAVLPLFSSFPLKRKIGVIISGFFTIIITGIWYFYWAPHLVDTYHFRLYFPKGLLEGLREIIQYPFQTFDKFFFTSFYSIAAFVAFVAGLVFMFLKKYRLLIYTFIITSLVFLVFMLKTGDVFSLHNYYIIPYMPIMALVAGYSLSLLKVRWQYLALLLICGEALFNQSYDFFIKDEVKYKLSLENMIEDTIGKNDLVIVNGGGANPNSIYFLHRKGWTADNEDLLYTGFIEERMEKGASYLVIEKRLLEYRFSYPLVIENEQIAVYKLLIER
jgi:4-amino-4-deoxy-L-arabinose transferase-like glycosyltransferase